jgi:hypothetical protein
MIFSSPTTLTVIAPGTSVLGTQATSMAAGTWAPLPAAAGQSTAMTQSGAWLTGGSNSAAWDPTRRIAHFVGKRQNTYPLRHIMYREATHDWVIGASAPPGNIGHGYDGNVCDPMTGRIYFRPYGAHPNRKIYYSDPSNFGTWGTSIPDWPLQADSYVEVVLGVAFWSGLMTGAGSRGAIVVYSTAGSGATEVQTFDVQTNSWLPRIVVPGGGSAYCSCAEYSTVLNVAIVGGGASSRNVYKIATDRSVTQLANSPKNFGYIEGCLTHDPITGRFLLLASDRSFYELNPAGSGTWTPLTGSRTPPSGGLTPLDSRGTICWPIPGYGVTVWASVNTAGGDPQMWLYKHV